MHTFRFVLDLLSYEVNRQRRPAFTDLKRDCVSILPRMVFSELLYIYILPDPEDKMLSGLKKK